jgi:hypothetical protein
VVGARLFSSTPIIGERVRVRGAIIEGEIMDTAQSLKIASSAFGFLAMTGPVKKCGARRIF